MLDRYKKKGGFNQLLTLLETCGEQKQKKFLAIIREEDPRWADALSAKMIDFDRIMKWSDSAVGEVTGTMLDIHLAALVKTLPPEKKDRLFATITQLKRKQVEFAADTLNPTPGEVATSYNKIYEIVRALTAKGVLRLDKIDPLLHVDADIEERLAQGADIIGVPSFAESHAPKEGESKEMDPLERLKQEMTDGPHLAIVTSIDTKTSLKSSNTLHAEAKDLNSARAENATLRKRLSEVQKENAAMKQELTMLKAKFDQIRRLS